MFVKHKKELSLKKPRGVSAMLVNPYKRFFENPRGVSAMFVNSKKRVVENT
jgi:hypothetical protein